MNRMTHTLGFFGLSAALIAGCSTTSSDNVKTSGFYVTYSVTQEGTAKPTAVANLQVGGATGTYIDLSESDSVSVDGTKLERQKTIINSIYYSASVEEKPTYTFVLARAEESSTTKVVSHPVPFALQETEKLSGAYTGNVTLNWSGSGTAGTMVISVEPQPAASGCTSRTVETGLPDNGTHTLSLDKLVPSDKTMPVCTYKLTLARETSSKIGSPFEGGFLVSRHTESVLLDVHP